MKMKSSILLDKGTLWKKIVKTTANALATGALLPIPTNYEFIEDGGVRFFVRILANLTAKDEERKKQGEKGERINPFLPFERDLFVADISETHVAVLNKFNVVGHHLLIITREFEEQKTLLTVMDFEALWACLDAYDGLGFYNGGEAAGASQPHKHLQLVPLPLAPEGPRVPVEPLLVSAKVQGRIGNVPGFPFLHVFGRLDTGDGDSSDHSAAAARSFDLYCQMFQHIGLSVTSAGGRVRQSPPYCLIVTREWMLLVPRSTEFFEGISINSLAYAGALLVRNERQLEVLKRHGPMTALKSTALQRNFNLP
jgi:ATP adenylyltransferase